VKTLLLFLVVCIMMIPIKTQAWWSISTSPRVSYVSEEPIPQYKIRMIRVYDDCGNFVGYHEEEVFVGYAYPQRRYYTESVRFSFGNSGHSDRHHHDYHGRYGHGR